MNKTININLAGVIFHVDEEAYKVLTDYLQKLKKQFQGQEGADEILTDIEARIAEIFSDRLSESRQVVDMNDVNHVINTMGQPEDYESVEDEDETTSSRQESYSQTTYDGPRRLYRDTDDNILGGVCSGMGAYFGIDPIWIRLIFVALVIGGGTGVWLYVILWIVIPEAKTTAQKLQMRGEPINVSNIEKSVKDELKGVGERVSNLGKNDRIRRSGNRVANALEEIFTSLLSIITAILKFTLKFIGILLLVIGVFVLVVLFSALFGYGFEMNGTLVGINDIFDYAEAFFPEGYGRTYIWTALALTIVAPVVGVISLAGRILFNFKMHNKAVASLAGLATFSGIVMFMILGFATAGNFRSYEYEEVSLAIENPSVETAIVIKGVESDMLVPHETEWYVNDETLIIKDVDFDIQRTSEEFPFLELRRESNGKSRGHARELARTIKYNAVQDGNTIYLDDYLTVPSETKFRDQEVDITLFLPEGYSVYLDRSAVDLLDNIQNVTNTWDHHMVNYVWMMTSKGLACADCPEDMEASEWEGPNDEWEDEWIEEAEELERQLENAPTSPRVNSTQTRDTIPKRSASTNLNAVIVTDWSHELML